MTTQDIIPADEESFFDFLTRSFISEGVLDTVRDQGLFGRIGANILGELTSPLGLASTALLATGVGAPVGAGLKAATAGTKLARAGSLAAGALTPVLPAARAASVGGIARSPALLARSLGAEALVTGGAIAGGGLAQEAGQLIPGPTRSTPGQIGLGLVGGLAGGGQVARSFRNINEAPTRININEVAAQNAETPIGRVSEKFRTLLALAPESEVQLEARRHAVRQARAAEGFGRSEGKVGAGAQSRAFLSAQEDELPGRRLFDQIGEFNRTEGDVVDLDTVRITELGIEGGIDLDDIRLIDQRIQEIYADRGYDKADTVRAFVQFMSGELPAPARLDKLRPVLGDQLINEAQQLTRTRGRRAFEEFVKFAGLPRALMASFDISAVMRQGVIGTIAHPKTALFKGRDSAFVRMLRAMKDPEFANTRISQILEDPDIQLATSLSGEDNLFLHRLDSPNLSQREEVYISSLADKIPGVGASERGFVTYLNELRYAMTKQRFAKLREQGLQITPEIIKLNNRTINHMTGRGGLGPLERSRTVREALSVAFWSPRLLTSRFQTLADAARASGRSLTADDPAVRALSKEIARDIATATGGILTAVAAVSFLPGVSVELNPKSSDFGKARVGNTRIDPWAGFQSIIRYSTQFVTGSAKSATTGNLREVERAEVLGRFLRSKLAPGLSSAVASDLPENFLLSGLTGGGENFIGEPIRDAVVKPGAGARVASAGQLEELPAEMNLLIDQMIPLLAQDMAEALESDGLLAAGGAGLSNVLGIGTTSFSNETRASAISGGGGLPETRDRSAEILNRVFR